MCEGNDNAGTSGPYEGVTCDDKMRRIEDGRGGGGGGGGAREAEVTPPFRVLATLEPAYLGPKSPSQQAAASRLPRHRQKHQEPPSASAPEPYKLVPSTGNMTRAHRRSSFVILAENRAVTPEKNGLSPGLPTSGRISPFRGRGFKVPPPRDKSRLIGDEEGEDLGLDEGVGDFEDDDEETSRQRRIEQRKNVRNDMGRAAVSQQNSPRRSLIPQPTRRRSVSLNKTVERRRAAESPKASNNRRSDGRLNVVRGVSGRTSVIEVARGRRERVSNATTKLSPIQGTPTRPQVGRTVVNNRSTVDSRGRSTREIRGASSTTGTTASSRSTSGSRFVSPSKTAGKRDTNDRGRFISEDRSLTSPKSSKTTTASRSTSSSRDNLTDSNDSRRTTERRPNGSVDPGRPSERRGTSSNNDARDNHQEKQSEENVDAVGLNDLLKRSSGVTGTSSVVNTTTSTAIHPLRVDDVNATIHLDKSRTGAGSGGSEESVVAVKDEGARTRIQSGQDGQQRARGAARQRTEDLPRSGNPRGQGTPTKSTAMGNSERRSMAPRNTTDNKGTESSLGVSIHEESSDRHPQRTNRISNDPRDVDSAGRRTQQTERTNGGRKSNRRTTSEDPLDQEDKRQQVTEEVGKNSEARGSTNIDRRTTSGNNSVSMSQNRGKTSFVVVNEDDTRGKGGGGGGNGGGGTMAATSEARNTEMSVNERRNVTNGASNVDYNSGRSETIITMPITTSNAGPPGRNMVREINGIGNRVNSTALSSSSSISVLGKTENLGNKDNQLDDRMDKAGKGNEDDYGYDRDASLMRSTTAMSGSSVESERSTDTGVSVDTVRGVSSPRTKTGVHVVKRPQEIETLSGAVMRPEQNGDPAVLRASAGDQEVVGTEDRPTEKSLTRWRRSWERYFGRCSGMRCLACRRNSKVLSWSRKRAEAVVREEAAADPTLSNDVTTASPSPGCWSNFKTRCRCKRADGPRCWSRRGRIAPEEGSLCCTPERGLSAICQRLLRCCKCECADAQRVKEVRTKHSLTSVAPPPLSEEPRAKIPDVLVEHNSLMRGAIPCLPVPLAWFCLVWNVLLPGTGTVWSGLFNICTGQPRFSAVAGPKARIGAFIVNLIVGVGQLFTVLFCLVGWGWSVWWGVTMIRLARKYKRYKASEAANGDAEARVGDATIVPNVPNQALRGIERAR